MSAGWEEARNILCVRLDNMGDVLMTTPAIRARAPATMSQTAMTSQGCQPRVDHVIALRMC